MVWFSSLPLFTTEQTFFFGHVAGVHCGSVQRMFYASLHKREPNVTKNEENEKKRRESGAQKVD